MSALALRTGYHAIRNKFSIHIARLAFLVAFPSRHWGRVVGVRFQFGSLQSAQNTSMEVVALFSTSVRFPLQACWCPPLLQCHSKHSEEQYETSEQQGQLFMPSETNSESMLQAVHFVGEEVLDFDFVWRANSLAALIRSTIVPSSASSCASPKGSIDIASESSLSTRLLPSCIGSPPPLAAPEHAWACPPFFPIPIHTIFSTIVHVMTMLARCESFRNEFGVHGTGIAFSFVDISHVRCWRL